MTAGAHQSESSGLQAYHAGLGPTMFMPYAADLRDRLPTVAGMQVLETAAGTGIVTRALLGRLPSDGRLVATDIGEPMLGVGRAYVGHDARLEWRLADAQALPFEDGSFDALVCQFGLMFFPDKLLAMREARRVLRPGGALLLNTWDSLDANAYARITLEALADLYPSDPPRYFHMPFSYCDRVEMHALLTAAGFGSVDVEHVATEAVSESSERFARGLVMGTPILGEVESRGTYAPEVVVAHVAERLTVLGGASPHRSPMRALVASARA